MAININLHLTAPLSINSDLHLADMSININLHLTDLLSINSNLHLADMSININLHLTDLLSINSNLHLTDMSININTHLSNLRSIWFGGNVIQLRLRSSEVSFSHLPDRFQQLCLDWALQNLLLRSYFFLNYKMFQVKCLKWFGLFYVTIYLRSEIFLSHWQIFKTILPHIFLSYLANKISKILRLNIRLNYLRFTFLIFFSVGNFF